MASKKARAGKRKCKRCKTVWTRLKGETFTFCEDCRSRCHRCNIVLTNQKAQSKRYQCVTCFTELAKFSKNDPKFRQRDSSLIRNYGITAPEYDMILELQNGVCYICQQPPGSRRLSVDHEHQPGESKLAGVDKRYKVRGLLCWRCNGGLAKYSDNADRMSRGADYLRTWPASETLNE